MSKALAVLPLLCLTQPWAAQGLASFDPGNCNSTHPCWYTKKDSNIICNVNAKTHVSHTLSQIDISVSDWFGKADFGWSIEARQTRMFDWCWIWFLFKKQSSLEALTLECTYSYFTIQYQNRRRGSLDRLIYEIVLSHRVSTSLSAYIFVSLNPPIIDTLLLVHPVVSSCIHMLSPLPDLNGLTPPRSVEPLLAHWYRLTRTCFLALSALFLCIAFCTDIQ